METQPVKIIFGEPDVGTARIFINGVELKNVTKIDFSDILPLDIPKVTFEIHAPDFTIEGPMEVTVVKSDISKEVE